MREGIKGVNMLDMDMVESTIRELENSDTTFVNCDKLASLYIIREHFSVKDEVTKELSDILPHYYIFCDKKREYQVNKVGEDVVIDSLQTVCNEILEFIQTLYSSTDMVEERTIILSLIDKLQDNIK